MECTAVCISSATSKHPSMTSNGGSVVVGHPCYVNKAILVLLGQFSRSWLGNM